MITASLTDAELPVASAAMWAEVTSPTGDTTRVRLAPAGSAWEGSVIMGEPGTYALRVRGSGTSRKGATFQRERTMTASVWHGGTAEPVRRSTDDDTAAFVRCLVGHLASSDRLVALLRRQDVDVKRPPRVRAMDAGTRRLSRRRPVDVVVVGGGPAGTATATRLAGAGRTVVLVERSGYERPRMGETLPPVVNRELVELDAMAAFQALQPVPSHESASAWGHGTVVARAHLCDPYGHGWHVDRARFDAMLADHAAAAGATVMRHAHALAVAPRRRRGADGHHRTSGRPRRAADRAGRRRNRSGGKDRQVPRRRQSSARSPGRRIGRRRAGRRSDHRRHVRRSDTRRMVVRLSTAGSPAHHLDVHRLGDRPNRPPHRPLRLVGGVAAHGTRRAPRPSDGADRATDGRVGGQPASSLPLPEAGWIAVGDAALAVDPLSSSGVATALASARLATGGAHGGTVGSPCRHRRLRHVDRRAC